MLTVTELLLKTQHFTKIVTEAEPKIATKKRVFNLADQKTRGTWEKILFTLVPNVVTIHQVGQKLYK